MVKQYIDIDSTYRNRTQFPNPAEFTVKLDGGGGCNLAFDASYAIDPISETAIVFPPSTSDPITTYTEYIDSSVTDGTVIERLNLPYVFTSSESTSILNLDGLPVPNAGTNGVTALEPSKNDNRFIDYQLEDVTLSESKTITSYDYVSGTMTLQSLIVYLYQVTGNIPSIVFNPSNYVGLPVSNVDNFYTNKLCRFGTEERRITASYINSSELYTIELQSAFVNPPSEGDLVEITCDCGTWSVTTNSAFSTPPPPYPAYRLPLPDDNLGGSLSRLLNAPATVDRVRVIRLSTNQYGIAYLQRAGTLTTGNYYDTMFFTRADDVDGLLVSTVQSFVAHFYPYVLERTDFSVVLASDTGYPITFSLSGSDIDESEYIVDGSRATAALGTGWAIATAVTNIAETPLPDQTISAVVLTNGNPAFAYSRVDSDTVEYYAADQATPTSDANWTINISLVPSVLGSTEVIRDMQIVDGKPMIVTVANFTGTASSIVYVLRATIANPLLSTDFTRIPVTPSGNNGLRSDRATSLAIIDGRPAIAWFGNEGATIEMVRANNTAGSLWGVNSFVAAGLDAFLVKLVEVTLADSTTRPMVIGASSTVLFTVLGSDVEGVNFDDPIKRVITTGITSLDVTINDQGYPYIVYTDGTNSNQINALTLGLAEIQQGQQYRIREGDPLVSGTGVTYTNSSLTTIDLVGGSSVDDAYNGKWVLVRTGIQSPNTSTAPSPLTQLNEYRRIIAYNGTTGVATVSPAFSVDLSTFSAPYVLEWEILNVSRDNYQRLKFFGGRAVTIKQPVCYAVHLVSLTLPNETLQSGSGGQIAFYPYVYVEFTSKNQSTTHIGQVFLSNNPYSSRALFKVPIYGVSNPDVQQFVVLNGQGITQFVKFSPFDDFSFRVILPNGETFQTSTSDTSPPQPPTTDLQISLVLGFERLDM
jgi:hypothetical protein